MRHEGVAVAARRGACHLRETLHESAAAARRAASGGRHMYGHERAAAPPRGARRSPRCPLVHGCGCAASCGVSMCASRVHIRLYGSSLPEEKNLP